MTDSNSAASKVLTPSLQASSTPLVLASGSAARRLLLAGAGLSFEVRTADIDEEACKQEGQARGDAIGQVALRLATAKALAAARETADPATLVIGADQMLECDGQWFDKPRSEDEARQQLRRLRGQTHHLHSAVVLARGGSVLWQHVARPALTMRTFSEAFLEAYLVADGEACLSCVGAYRLEGPGAHLFERIEGSHDAILGLPLFPLLHALRDLGILMK